MSPHQPPLHCEDRATHRGSDPSSLVMPDHSVVCIPHDAPTELVAAVCIAVLDAYQWEETSDVPE